MRSWIPCLLLPISLQPGWGGAPSAPTSPPPSVEPEALFWQEPPMLLVFPEAFTPEGLPAPIVGDLSTQIE